MNLNRLERTIGLMKENDIKQMVISDPASIFYLTGKWIHPGERMLALYINAKGNHKIFINKLFPVTEDLGVEKVWFTDTDDSVKLMTNYIEKDQKLGIDKNWPSRFLIGLMENNAASGYLNSSFVIDEIRMCKDQEEQEKMHVASKINDMAVERMIGLVAENRSEKEMAALLKSAYEEFGADGYSFGPIIAYGPNAADPHHDIDSSLVKPGDSIIIDIGCKKDSYCSDMTRTVFYKEASEKAKNVYEIVKEANLKAIDKVKPGVRFCDVDMAARKHIEDAGYGEYFTHRTGHSIGIDVHDFGDVSSVNEDVLKPGMIFSVEPGIYLPGEFGVRIEDLVLVTEDGCKVLNSYTKDLQIVR